MADHKTHFRLGDFEFTSEGAQETVAEQWNLLIQTFGDRLGDPQFLALISGRSTDAGESKTAKTAGSSGTGDPAGRSESPKDKSEEDANGGEIPMDQALLDRLFIQGRDKVVSLKFLPKTATRDADGLLLLLLGKKLLAGEHDVMATELTKAARQSGLQLPRVDRTIAKHKTLITEGGFGKGKRYGLNNQGIQRAVALAKGIVG